MTKTMSRTYRQVKLKPGCTPSEVEFHCRLIGLHLEEVLLALTKPEHDSVMSEWGSLVGRERLQYADLRKDDRYYEFLLALMKSRVIQRSLVFQNGNHDQYCTSSHRTGYLPIGRVRELRQQIRELIYKFRA